MSIQSQIERISAAKAALKDAINSKGGNITSQLLGDYASAVAALPAGSGGTDPSDATATAGDILDGKTAYVSGGKVSGTIPTASAATYTPTTSNQIISAGVYLGGSQTILGDASLVAGNIKSGASIFGVSGSYSPSTDDATAAPGDILDGKTAYISGGKVSGTIPIMSGGTITPTSSAQVISSGYYLGGDITIPAVSAGVEVTLGYISSGLFQPLTFSGTTAYDGGSAVNLSCYRWNLPGESSGGSSGGAGKSGVWTYSDMNSKVLVSSASAMNGKTIGTGTPDQQMFVYDGGTISNTAVNGQGYLWIFGGTASGTTASGGGQICVSGGTATDITLYHGGHLKVYKGAPAISTTVNSGGRVDVYSRGTADHVTVLSGGTLAIYQGATVTDLVSPAGAIIINS